MLLTHDTLILLDRSLISGCYIMSQNYMQRYKNIVRAVISTTRIGMCVCMCTGMCEVYIKGLTAHMGSVQCLLMRQYSLQASLLKGDLNWVTLCQSLSNVLFQVKEKCRRSSIICRVFLGQPRMQHNDETQWIFKDNHYKQNFLREIERVSDRKWERKRGWLKEVGRGSRGRSTERGEP